MEYIVIVGGELGPPLCIHEARVAGIFIDLGRVEEVCNGLTPQPRVPMGFEEGDLSLGVNLLGQILSVLA